MYLTENGNIAMENNGFPVFVTPAGYYYRAIRPKEWKYLKEVCPEFLFIKEFKVRDNEPEWVHVGTFKSWEAIEGDDQGRLVADVFVSKRDEGIPFAPVKASVLHRLPGETGEHSNDSLGESWGGNYHEIMVGDGLRLKVSSCEFEGYEKYPLTAFTRGYTSLDEIKRSVLPAEKQKLLAQLKKILGEKYNSKEFIPKRKNPRRK